MCLQEKHHAVLLQLLAHELGSKPEDIVDFELNLCDVQPGTIGGELCYVGCASRSSEHLLGRPRCRSANDQHQPQLAENMVFGCRHPGRVHLRGAAGQPGHELLHARGAAGHLRQR